MSNLAHPTAKNELALNLYAVDDHKEELKPALSAARDCDIKPKPFDTATEWAKAAQKATQNTILLADNRIDGLDNLGVVGFPNIKTDHGNNAGLRLLIDYCNMKNINCGMKVILTAFPLSTATQTSIDRRNIRLNDNIVVLYKHNSNVSESLNELFRRFREKRRMGFLKEKFEFVSAVMDGWGLSQQERLGTLGLFSKEDVVYQAMAEGTTASLDAEAKYDLLYRLWANLNLLFGDDDVAQRRWLNAPNPKLNGKSPLQIISTGYQDALAHVVFQIEGP